jgi:hypothetical protein
MRNNKTSLAYATHHDYTCISTTTKALDEVACWKCCDLLRMIQYLVLPRGGIWAEVSVIASGKEESWFRRSILFISLSKPHSG